MGRVRLGKEGGGWSTDGTTVFFWALGKTTLYENGGFDRDVGESCKVVVVAAHDELGCAGRVFDGEE